MRINVRHQPRLAFIIYQYMPFVVKKLASFQLLYKEELHRTMYSSDSYSQEILKINPRIKPNSTVTDYQQRHSDPNTQVLQEKLSILEHQYTKMETEYIQKIRELKSILLQKSRKQSLLSGEITSLREEFKHHQEEISKVSQQLTNENSKEAELKPQKKNSSPGLIKKSLEIEKKHEKKVSPSTHTINTNYLLHNVLGTKSGPNSSPTSKRASPKNSSPGLLRLLKNQQPQIGTSKKLISDSEHNETKQTIQKSSNDNKKAYSPTNNQSIKIGVLSGKQDAKINGPSAGTNPSPKRLIRRSPGQKAPAQVQSKKDAKKLLGNLKETMQEVF